MIQWEKEKYGEKYVILRIREFIIQFQDTPIGQPIIKRAQNAFYLTGIDLSRWLDKIEFLDRSV